MYNYPEEIIEEVRLNNDIVDVVSEYVRLERKGKDFFGLCPFHKEKTPSFSVVSTKQIFYCFGCGKGGNVINFVMNAENLDFIEAVKHLADRAHIQLPEGESSEEIERARIKQEILKINTEAARFFFNNLNNSAGENARQYLKRRKISEHTIRRFGLGYSLEDWDSLYKYLVEKGFDISQIKQSGLILSNKNGGYCDRFRGRVIFPIFDIRGNVIGFGGRVLDSSLPKYMNSPETLVYNKGRNLYALNIAKNSGEKRLVIVEGYMDVISLHQSGIINSVASLGTALTESQGRILKKYAEEVIISYDADTAGQAATLRGLELLSDIGCNVKVLIIPQGKDPDEFISKNGPEEFKKLIDKALSLVEYKIRILKNQINTESIEGTITFLNKVAELLSKVDNLVEREMYLKKISKDYNVSEESLRAEIYKRVKPKTSFRQTAAIQSNFKVNKDKGSEIGVDNKIDKDEKMILALLCIDNSIYSLVKDSISINDFSQGNNKSLAEIVFERLGNNKTIVAAELLNAQVNIDSNEYAKVINEVNSIDDTRKAIAEKIRSFKLLKIEKRQKEILEALKNEERLEKGDVEKLKAELNSLLMKRKMI
ncbi:MAG: DNA primase [Clostridia bacterium]|nr:DNA primase [Clostridia bacterium]